MLINVIFLLISSLPSLAVFFMLRNNHGDDAEYRKTCLKLLGKGLLSTFQVMLLSGTFALIRSLTNLNDLLSPLMAEAYRTFLINSFSEETVKYLNGRATMKKMGDKLSWLDTISFMTISGMGFGLAEDVVYAVSTNPIQIVVRGITMSHAVYGMIMGYFTGKRIKTGKKIYGALSFLVTFFLHGMYNLSLSDKLGDFGVFFAVTSTFLLTCYEVFMIFFIRKARNKEEYTEPLIAKADVADSAEQEQDQT